MYLCQMRDNEHIKETKETEKFTLYGRRVWLFRWKAEAETKATIRNTLKMRWLFSFLLESRS